MDVQIRNNGLFVDITINGRPIMLSKFNMPVVQPIRDDCVRIVCGNDPLSDLYIRVADVTVPKKIKDADELVTVIASFLLAGPATNI